MIKIIHFSDTTHDLSDYINTIRRSQRFNMQIIWQYNRDDSLEVFISFEAAEAQTLERLLCAELSANGYLYLNDIQKIPYKYGIYLFFLKNFERILIN